MSLNTASVTRVDTALKRLNIIIKRKLNGVK